MPLFKKSLQLQIPVEDLFAWHKRPGAFERLTPPWEAVQVKAKSGNIRDGDWLRIQMGPLEWHARHSGYIPNKQFIDTQSRGPFAHWRHRHLFQARGTQASELTDEIEYQLPLTPFSAPAAPFVRARLDRMFDYRHRITQSDLETHAHYLKGKKTMRVLISGASGLVGSTLTPFLTTGGHEVWHLVRRPAQKENEIYWNPAAEKIDLVALEGFDAWVHLAGESIANGRWSEARKRSILESRTTSTRLLSESLKKLQSPPQVVISASAVGYYGDRGETELSETAPGGQGFLAEVCQAWESSAETIRETETRLVNLRIGIVLSSKGGALNTMLLPFQMGLGGKLGSGQQYMSWISIDDLMRCIYHCLMTDISGPVNAVSPYPVQNKEFTKILAKTLHRPVFFQVPGLALQLALGEMADEMLLSSTRALPQALLDSGFEFHYPKLEATLKHVLGR